MPDAGQLQRIIQWVGSTGNYGFLESILSTGGRTVEAMAESIFRGAIDSGDEKLVTITLDAGVDPDMALGYSQRNPLQVAASRGFLSIAAALLERGASPNVPPRKRAGGTALQESAKNGNAQLLKLLLENGAIADGTSLDEPTTALHISVCKGNIQMAQMLLDHYADVNYDNDDGRTWCAPYALSVAIKDGNAELTKILLNAGANVEKRARRGPSCDQTSLQQACAGGARTREIVFLLLEHGVDMNAPALGERGRTALQEAVFSQDMKIVEKLLDSGANVNGHPNPLRGCTAIQLAAKRGNVDLVKLLLSRGADINAPAASLGGFTALQAAADSGSPDIVRLLLGNGARVDDPPSLQDGQTALQAATGFGILPPEHVDRVLRAAEDSGYLSPRRLQVVRMLMDAGANWNYSTSRSISAASILHEAVLDASAFVEASDATKGVEFVKILLDSGLDVNIPHMEGTVLQALVFQCSRSPHVLELAHLLIAAGAEVNARPAETYYDEFEIGASLTALQAAAADGNTDLVRILVQAGANVNARAVPPNGISAISAAARFGNQELVQLLLESGAKANVPARTDQDTPVLVSAINRGELGMAEILLAAGANINTPGMVHDDENGFDVVETPLQLACRTNRLLLVEFLLARNSDPNRLGNNPDPMSPLAHAVLNGSEPLVNTLLAAGADVDYVGYGKYSQTPIQIAVDAEDLTLVRLLLEAGADVNLRAANQHTTTHLAISGGNSAIIHDLLEAGADIHAEALGDGGRTALQAAVEQNNATLLQLLVTRGADINAEPAYEEGRTAIQIAAEAGNIRLIELLLDCGADVNAEPAYERGVTALQAAAIGGFLGVAQKLLEAGAQVDAAAAPYEGRTALQGAAEHGRLDMCQLLLNNMADEDVNFDDLDDAMELASDHGHLAVVNLIKDYYDQV